MWLPKAANCSPEIHVKEIQKKFRKACELERTLTIFEIFRTEFGESGSYTRGTAWSPITYTRAPRCKLLLSPRTALLRPIAVVVLTLRRVPQLCRLPSSPPTPWFSRPLRPPARRAALRPIARPRRARVFSTDSAHAAAGPREPRRRLCSLWSACLPPTGPVSGTQRRPARAVRCASAQGSG